MKPHVIVLLTNDSTVVEIALRAAPDLRHGLRLLKSSSAAFELLREGADDVDLAVIDLDPGSQGLAILEAIHHRWPIVALTSPENNYVQSVAAGGVATVSLSKPFTEQELVAAIERAMRSEVPLATAGAC